MGENNLGPRSNHSPHVIQVGEMEKRQPTGAYLQAALFSVVSTGGRAPRTGLPVLGDSAARPPGYYAISHSSYPRGNAGASAGKP